MLMVYIRNFLRQLHRYFNTDFVFLSALQNRSLRHIRVSYDIACQWHIHLAKRCDDFPPQLQNAFKALTQIIYAIPKFHLPAHGSACWSLYSLNYLIGSARVDGEAIERFWALSNSVATSTREMTSGARHDFLESFANGSCDRPHPLR